MAEKDLRTSIQSALQRCAQGKLAGSVAALLNTLGYSSEKTYDLAPNTTAQFVADFDPEGRINSEKALLNQWKSVDVLFQVTDDELKDAFSGQQRLIVETSINAANIQSYLFIAVDLAGDYYSRTTLANITREINRLFPMPVMVVLRHGEKLSMGIITRRVNKRDASRDVLEKVTLIKAIRASAPHRAHVEILNDLSLTELAKGYPLASFADLQRAWEKTLDTSELNKKFYREVADWYFWAVENVQFPEGGEPDVQKRNSTNVIRLITRLIFIWFIKEKGLVPEDLFNPQQLKAILKPSDPKDGVYYRAILQNLFFATLNTEMGPDRRFRGKNRSGGMDAHYGISTVYRFEDCFLDPAAALRIFAVVPFLNGGLFECLDKREQKLLVDGFSDDPRNQPVVPDALFFGEERDVDLSDVYGDAHHGHEKVRGLINIFNSYKFTIEENTPLEEEIALDPELLGKVFENLLAAYNPETGTTARKQTGSFYTPREIVNYMVDEALIAYLETRLTGAPDAQQRLRHLLEYNQEPHLFSEAEAQRLITAIDGVKVLDPACGSGAFPMGALHKLVFILSKLDPGNRLWMQRQIDKASEIPDPAIREHVIEDIEKSFRENELDYGRKLYLIQNCIYGVDIQPIAVQIAKLRFFISLVVDQRADSHKPNLGIRPLPNLETKFVAANTLISIDRPQESARREEPTLVISDDILEKCNLLIAKFRQYLLVRTPNLKESLRADGVRLGAQINKAFENDPDWNPIQVEWIFDTAKKVDDLRNILPLQQKEKAADVQFVTAELRALEDRLAWVRSEIFTARTPATKRKYREMDRQLRSEIATLLKNDGWGSQTASELAAWDPYDQNISAGFFDPEWMFGVTNGFDITLGNPPYLRADAGKEHLEFRKLLEKSGRYETLWEKWDLFIPFIELGYKILKPNGITTMIVSDAYCHSKYAQKSQTWFLKNSRVLRLDFFSKIKIFDAAVKNVTYFYQKVNGDSNIPERRVRFPEFGNINLLPSAQQANLDYRVFFPEDTQAESFSGAMKLLDEICYISVGMVVHADEKIAQGAFELSDLVSEFQDEIHPKPFVEGKYLSRWLPLKIKWLEWGTKRAPSLFRRPTFPELYEVAEKLISVDMAAGTGKLRVVYDDQQLYHNHSAWSFVPWYALKGVCNNSIKKVARYKNERGDRNDLPSREMLERISEEFSPKYLVGVMNSRFAQLFLKANRRSNLHLYPEDWKNLPIPDVTPEQQAPVINFVEQILAIKSRDINADVTSIEDQLDSYVNSLYGLNQEAGTGG